MVMCVTVTNLFETQSPHLLRMSIMTHAYFIKSLQIKATEMRDMKKLEKWKSQFKCKRFYLGKKCWSQKVEFWYKGGDHD